MTTAAIASFLKPWATLLLFALVVIPLRLLFLRMAPPSWRPTLTTKLKPWVQNTIMFAVIGAVLLYASLAKS